MAIYELTTTPSEEVILTWAVLYDWSQYYNRVVLDAIFEPVLTGVTYLPRRGKSFHVDVPSGTIIAVLLRDKYQFDAPSDEECEHHILEGFDA